MHVAERLAMGQPMPLRGMQNYDHSLDGPIRGLKDCERCSDDGVLAVNLDCDAFLPLDPAENPIGAGDVWQRSSDLVLFASFPSDRGPLGRDGRWRAPVVAAISSFIVGGNPGLAMPFTLVGSLGGLALVLIATFGRKQDNPAIVLSYAALEGLFLGAISWVFGNVVVADGNAGALITQAVLGTIGVFFGMLVVYKTGAIRVTPKFTRFLVAGMIGVLVLMLGNFLLGMFGVGGGEGMGLRSGGPLAIVFSLVCIGLAAFSFLIDFDSADQMIRAGAPEKAAWGVALGLTVTLVWLYLEILRLLSYFQQR
jgi:uncharacterized YccA/Bax inhibitor family protein